MVARLVFRPVHVCDVVDPLFILILKHVLFVLRNKYFFNDQNFSLNAQTSMFVQNVRIIFFNVH